MKKILQKHKLNILIIVCLTGLLFYRYFFNNTLVLYVDFFQTISYQSYQPKYCGNNILRPLWMSSLPFSFFQIQTVSLCCNRVYIIGQTIQYGLIGYKNTTILYNYFAWTLWLHLLKVIRVTQLSTQQRTIADYPLLRLFILRFHW
jgi:hypothetical protein